MLPGIDREAANIPDVIPDYTARGVTDVDFEALHGKGVDHVFLDVDLTIRRAFARRSDQEIVDFLLEQRAMGNIGSISLATNSPSDMTPFAEPLDAEVFQPFTYRGERIKKPDPRFFTHMLGKLGVQASAAATIGDRCLADISGANQVGMTTVLVEPLGADYWFDRLRGTRRRDKRALLMAQKAIQHLLP